MEKMLAKGYEITFLLKANEASHLFFFQTCVLYSYPHNRMCMV